MKRKFLGLLLILVFATMTPRLVRSASPAPPAQLYPEPAYFGLPTGYLAQRIFAPALEFPSSVDIGPSDVIVVTDNAGDRVIQVHEDSTLTTFAAPSSNPHAGVAFDNTGNLLVVDKAQVLWKVAGDGSATLLATGVHPADIDVAPSGDIYATGWATTDVQRITPAGQVSVFASGFKAAGAVAVNPVNGDVYVADWGAASIFKANSDGSISLLTDGLTTDNSYLAFSSDGTLYHMSIFTGLSTISTSDGTRTEITWLKDKIAVLGPKNIAIDSQGRIVVLDHTYNHVVRLDLDAETIQVLSLGMGNSGALAVAPNGGGVFLGVSHPSRDGSGSIMRIEADGSTVMLTGSLLPSVDAMVFGSGGVGYVSAMQPGSGGFASTIYTTSLTSITGTLTSLPYVANSLAIDPITGFLWGTGYQELWYLDGSGLRHTLPFTLSKGDEGLTFTPDGTLYVHTNTSDVSVAPVARGVYRVDPLGPTFTQIADLSTVNMCCVMGRIGAGGDGNIYWVGYGDRHTPGNRADMHMLRITPAGEVTLFGRHLPVDPAAVTAAPDSTDLYFSSASGVFRVMEAKILFLPLILRNQ